MEGHSKTKTSNLATEYTERHGRKDKKLLLLYNEVTTNYEVTKDYNYSSKLYFKTFRVFSGFRGKKSLVSFRGKKLLMRYSHIITILF